MKNRKAPSRSFAYSLIAISLVVILLTSITTRFVARAAAIVTTDPNNFQTLISGLGTATVINFEDIDASPVNNITADHSPFNGGFYAGQGLTFSNPNGDPLYIAPGGLFWNASNSLSVSSFPFDGGSDTNDDLVVTFDPPVIAAGFTLVDNGAQQASEFVQFKDAQGGVITQVDFPPGFEPFRAFLGIVSVDRPIAEINIVEAPNDGDDVAYDDFTFVPRQGCSNPPAGLVSWWPGDGDADDIKDGNPGMLMNGAMFAPGVVGQTFSFDGIDDFVKVPKASNLDLSSEVTLDFWMRAEPDNLMNNCCQGLVTTDFYAVEISGGGDPVVGVNFFVNTTDGGFVHTSDANGGGAVVTPGEWHHIAGTYDGTKLQLYVDGQPWGNPRFHSGTILPMLTNSFLTIGSEDGRTTCPFCIGNRYFKGQIDEVEVFNRALTAAEIAAIYGAGVAGKCKDADGDGVLDGNDACPNSIVTATVVIDGCNSGVPNTVLANGCSISDKIAECAANASNHGEFVSCVAHLTNDLKQAGIMTNQQKGAIQNCAAHADIP
jgi:hypothetical protein